MGNFSTKFLSTSLVLFAVAFTSGCQQVNQNQIASVLMTKQGVKAESFLPKDPFMVMKFGASTEAQQEKSDALIKKFDGSELQAFLAQLTTEMNSGLLTKGMSLEKDLLPIIGNNPELLIAVYMKIDDVSPGTSSLKQQPSQESGRALIADATGGRDTTPEPSDVIITVKVDDTEKLQKFLDQLLVDGSAVKESYKDMSFYTNKRDNSALAVSQDLLVFANSPESLQKALDLKSTPDQSLLQEQRYQKVLAKLPKESVGLMYIDMQSYGALFAQAYNDTSSSAQSSEVAATMQKVFDALESEVFVLIAEDHGYRIQGFVFAGKDGFGSYLHTPKNKAELCEKLLVNSPILCSESSDLAQSLQLVAKIYSTMFVGFDDALAQIDFGMKAEGIDFQKDVMTFLDKSSAFILADNDGLIPTIGFFADASSNVAGAQKLMTLLDEKLQMLVTQSQVNVSMPGFVAHDNLQLAGGNSARFALQWDKLPADKLATLPAVVSRSKTELYYGVDGNKLAYLSYYPNFAQQSEKALGQSETYKKLKGVMVGYDYGMTYGEFTPLMNWFDRFLQFGVTSSGRTDGIAEWNLIKKYLQPLKGFMFASKMPQKDMIEMGGFVWIGE